MSDGRHPVYSIGAVARMLGLEPATLRTWEERYATVVPERGPGGQRVYTRDEIDRLRFVVHSMRDGASAADAHRLLDERVASGAPLDGATSREATLLVLVAERDKFASEFSEYLLRTEGFEVDLAPSALAAQTTLARSSPQLAVIEVAMPGALELCHRLAGVLRVPVVAVSALDLEMAAIEAGASVFVPKPLAQLTFVSAVRDVVGSSALARRRARRGTPEGQQG